MPDMFLRTTSFEKTDLNVLFSEQGLRSPRMRTIDLTTIPLDANGQQFILPGSLMIDLPNGYGSIYRATKAKAPTTTASDTLTVQNPAVFKPGDTVKLTTAAGTTVGVVESITETTVVLVANAAVAVTAGASLVAADAGSIDDVLSVIDLSEFSNDVAAYTSCSVYGDRLPFWNDELQAKLPEITLV
jgi:hypothetical protein